MAAVTRSTITRTFVFIVGPVGAERTRGEAKSDGAERNENEVVR